MMMKEQLSRGRGPLEQMMTPLVKMIWEEEKGDLFYKSYHLLNTSFLFLLSPVFPLSYFARISVLGQDL